MTNMQKRKKINLAVTFIFSLLLSFSLFAGGGDKANKGHAAGKDHKHGTHAGHSHDKHADGHDHHGHDDGEFDVTGTILHHIADANGFHVGGDVYIPLPCMIYNTTHGKFDMFMSNNFGHVSHGNGEQTYKAGSGMEYKLVADRIKPVDGSNIIDFSITKNVFGMLLGSLILCLIFFSVAKACRKNEGKKPTGLQNAMEPFVNFVVEDIAKPNIGHKYMKFVPYLCTVFFFILVLNLLGLIPFFPGSANVTGNIAVTLVLSVITFLLTNLNGSKDYWMHIFNPPVPMLLKPPLALLEFIGIFTKPFALMIRLFANISAGHIIILSLVSLVFIFGKMGASMAGAGAGAAIAVPFVLFMNCIELLVAFLQAFIFTLLSALFIGLAVEEHDHH